MFRRSIFLGLMVLLGSVLIYMILSARKQEKRTKLPPAEIIRQSAPSATRVLSPGDLEVTGSTMEILRRPAGSEPAAGFSARHVITVRNLGSRRYEGFMLRFSYLSASGNSVEVRSQQVPQDVPTAATVRLQDVVIEGLPRRARTCRVSIAWADLAK